MILFFVCISCVSIGAQENVFVLVDVSKSIGSSELNDAKQALTEVLTGTQLSKAFLYEGRQQDLANFKINQNDKLAISVFGSLRTSLLIDPNLVPVQNVGIDINKILNSVSWTPTDMRTYIMLAKAKIAEYAKNHGISSYRLYLVSDNITDDYGPNGRPNYTDDYTRKLVDGYNSSTNQVTEAGYTKLKFNPNSDFMLSFSPKVDVSAYSLPPKPNVPTPIPPVDTVAIIKIVSPITGKKNKEVELNKEIVTVNWTCTNCPEGIRYTVSISGYDGNKYKDTRKNLAANTVTFNNLSDGKYRITVSASNYSANLDTTYVNVSTGGFVWIIIVLLILAAGISGYYFWNKNRMSKTENSSSTRNGKNSESIFKQAGTGITTADSSKTTYF